MRIPAFPLLVTLTLLFAGTVEASPMYVLGNECPSDAQMSSYTRQYYVTDALACVFDPAVPNIQGTTAEANTYLGPLGNWVGLGEDPTGFNWTADAGNDDGTFTIGLPLTSQYSQFVVGIKDGGDPKWAMFLLSFGDLSSDWGFRTDQGSLSHFVLYGRTGNTQCPNIPCTPTPFDVTPVPEPATMFLLGSGLLVVARMRKRST